MLERQNILNLATEYLNKHGYPIITDSARVVFPHEETRIESKEFLEENRIARVSFSSNYEYDPSDPNQDLVPGSFVVYVNYITGDVRMPRHMA